MVSEKTHFCWVFQMYFLTLSNQGTIYSHYVREQVEISTADISKTRQLTPKLSMLINSSTGKRKTMYFSFWGELTLFLKIVFGFFNAFWQDREILKGGERGGWHAVNGHELDLHMWYLLYHCAILAPLNCPFNEILQFRQTVAWTKAHFNSVTFLSSVQTEGADITNKWQCDMSHTHTLMHSSVKCLDSIAIFTSPFASDSLELCPTNRTSAQRGSLYVTALCTIVKDMLAVLLCTPHISLLSWVPFWFQIWNLVILHRFKSPV